MKKVLLVNNGYPSKTQPNYVTYIAAIRECLEVAGFHVDLLVLDSNFTTRLGKYFQFFVYYWRLFFFRNYRRYDFVYINNYPYSFLPMVFHFGRMKRVVIHWHGDDILPNTKASSYLNRISYRFIPKAAIHLAPSLYFAQEVSRKLNIPVSTIGVSASGGIDTKRFLPAKKKLSPVLNIGFASGLLRNKGIELVIKLLQDSRRVSQLLGQGFEVHFIAYGAQKAHYLPILDGMDGAVCHNVYDRDRMADFYNRIDVLVFPSLTESLGLVALEAMACDVPVIATDDLAFRETVISEVSGERFRRNDYESFIESLRLCASRLPTYRSREFVIKNFSRESVAANYRIVLN